MTPLLPLFTEAFMAEQKRYKIEKLADGEITTHGVWLRGEPMYAFTGTRADCERFVVERCARKGFEAMWKLYAAGGPINTEEALFCQRFLATEPETSGDAG